MGSVKQNKAMYKRFSIIKVKVVLRKNVSKKLSKNTQNIPMKKISNSFL